MSGVPCPHCSMYGFRAFDADGGVYIECHCGWEGLIPNSSGHIYRAVKRVEWNGMTALYTKEEWAYMQRLLDVPKELIITYEMKATFGVLSESVGKEEITYAAPPQQTKQPEKEKTLTDGDALVELMRATTVESISDIDQMTFL